MTGTTVAAKAGTDLESVYRRESPRLWRALVAYSGDKAVADDAVSEAFTQALRRGPAIRKPDKWVWRAAFRIAAGDLKERRRSAPLLSEGVVHNPEPAWDLIQALQKLPESQRATVVLRHYAGYSAIEIARMVGSTPPAIRMQLTRGRRRLRTLLDGGEIDA
jgi:RNA polymerase sigma-70 factor (ECF subfamily)